jgi:hypothetical protein
MRRTHKLLVVVAVVLVVVLVIVLRSTDEAQPVAPAGDAFTLDSPAFADGETIPEDFTCEGRNVSPPLEWEKAPDGTVSFALVMDDPDAPIGTFTHWLICDLAGRLTGLPEGIPAQDVVRDAVSATQGQNGFKDVGYGGPCPPTGATHRYVFTLYALDEKLDLPGRFTKNQLRAAMDGHILGEAVLTGRFGRAE